MDIIMGISIIIGFVLCYSVGRFILSVMGIIMFDSIIGLIIKPIIMGFFTIIAIIILLSLFLKLLLWATPFIIIIVLVFILFKAIKK